MKKIILSLVLVSGCLISDETNITSIDMINALGKAIINQQKLEARHEELLQRIKSLENEILLLKEKTTKLTPPKVENLAVNGLFAISSRYKTNVRSESNNRSKIINVLPQHTKVEVVICNENTADGAWCQIKSGGFIKKDLLSFNDKNNIKKRD